MPWNSEKHSGKVVNRFPVYDSDLEPMGFRLPTVRDGVITAAVVDEVARLLAEGEERAAMVTHNVEVVRDKLGHERIADCRSLISD